ncbi:TPA: hypothetical protein ACV7UK_004025 [Escherichia coli]|nr:hypothetical protein [Escherichia coli]ELJ1750070.1 hypothetical protein [Escherichia coli]MBS9063347.1 hypothetical protein [Escherichia coli]HBA8949382.1 hypothetical protein [Escherichia coli]HBA9742290.1 hypothetical protein [Escherichia coli]
MINDKQKENAEKIIPTINAQYNNKWLTHRLIKMDYDNGTAFSVIQKAWNNTEYFILSAKEKCQSATTTLDFLYCANGLLGEMFPYKASNMVSPAYAGQFSDCDLNVYLIIDAAKESGRHIEIVFAPYHAFISYIDDNNVRAYWETTDNNNKGDIADLNHNHWYQKTFNKFYYFPHNENYIESLYPVLIATHVDESHKKEIYNNIKPDIKKTPLAYDLYYSMKNEISSQDAEQINLLLREDITSSYKQLLLTGYFIKNGNTEAAQKIIDNIRAKNCKSDCIEFKKKVYWYFFPSYLVSQYASEFGVTLSLEDIYYYYAFSIIIILSLSILILPNSKNKNKKRRDNNK